MNNSSLIFHFYEDAELEIIEYIFNNPNLLSDLHFILIAVFIISILTFLTSIVGIVGNGMVIWLLGFRLKRNPFTTYILNLAVADIGILTFSTVGSILGITFLFWEGFSSLGFNIYADICSLMYIADQLLLTTISVDRCLVVLFPLWYRCHRPLHLSGIVCLLLWVFSFLMNGLDLLLIFADEFMLLQFIVNVAICTPLMSVSTIILFVKICTKSQQRKRGKLLWATSIALFSFLIFGFPVNYCYFVFHYYIWDVVDVKSLLIGDHSYSELNSTTLLKFLSRMDMIIIPPMVAFMCTTLNCSINPLIYFLVGRKKKGRSRLSMKFALQRVFKDEENCRGQDGPIAETQF